MQADAAAGGAPLEGLKERFGVGDWYPGVAEAHQYPVVFVDRGADGELLAPGRIERAAGIPHQVEKYLEQRVLVGANEGQVVGLVPGDFDSRFLKPGPDHNPQMIEHGSKAGDVEGLLGFRVQLRGHQLLQAVHQGIEAFDLLGVHGAGTPLEAGGKHPHGAAQVTHFVEERPGHDAFGDGQHMERAFFAVAQLFGGVENHGAQPGGGWRARAGEPDVGEESLSAAAAAGAFKHGAH